MSTRWVKTPLDHATTLTCWEASGGCNRLFNKGEYFWDEIDVSGSVLCDPCYQRLHGVSAEPPEVDFAEPSLHEWLESQPTREEWLQRRLYDTVRPIVEAAGYTMPPIRVSCGWTGSGIEGCTLGVCYDKTASEAGIYEIFISPTLVDPIAIVGTMLHETAHAIAGCGVQHHAIVYGVVAEKLDLTRSGMDGKGTRWPDEACPSLKLQDTWRVAMEKWEPYPHAVLLPPPPSTAGGTGSYGQGKGERQSTRLLKASCATCGYTVRVTMKWASRGLPICGICTDTAGEFARMQLEKGEVPS